MICASEKLLSSSVRRSGFDLGNIDEMLAQLEQLHAEYGFKLQSALDGNARARNELSTAAEASAALADGNQRCVEEQLLMADTLDAPWQGFSTSSAPPSTRPYIFTDQMLGFLDHERASVWKASVRRWCCWWWRWCPCSSPSATSTVRSTSTRATLKGFGSTLNQVAAGDMTVRVNVRSQDELGELGEVFNGTVANIRDLIDLVGQTVVEVERQADRVELVSGESSQAVITSAGRSSRSPRQ